MNETTKKTLMLEALIKSITLQVDIVHSLETDCDGVTKKLDRMLCSLITLSLNYTPKMNIFDG